MRVAAAAIAAFVLVSCATDQNDRPSLSVFGPAKGIGVAAVALGAALDFRSHEGKPEVHSLQADSNGDNQLTWLGHSSFLLRIGKSSILLDPIFSDQPQLPVPLRPKRISPVPMGSDTLARLDAVVISHVDHDHLDLPTLRGLSARFPEALLFVTKGTVALAAKSGFVHIIDLDIYEGHHVGSITYTALPAYHYGRRDMVGINRTLALGWEIKTTQHKIYFSGDTGYGPEFKEIRKRRGRFDTALVPIGAFKPALLFNDVHATPEQAVKIASDLGAPVAIANHWGTFAFGVEKPSEAKARFLGAASSSVTLKVLAIGETISLF